ncbi:hypothetical protein BH23CHL5_BH23CHL5_02190 [soil metagenome]
MNSVWPAGYLVSSSRNFFEWLTGVGFLMLHATCFFVALVVMIPWNLYSEPGDFWVANPLTKWAFLLAFHALLGGAWSLVCNVLLKEADPAELGDPSNRLWHAARVQAARASIGAPVRVPRQLVPPPVDMSSSEWNSPANAGHTNWSREDSQDLLSDVDSQPTSAASSEGWVQPHQELDQSATKLLQETTDQREVEYQPSASRERSHGPLSAAARASGEYEGDSEFDPELEWHWIEAAASAWLNRKEEEISPRSDYRVRNNESDSPSHT